MNFLYKVSTILTEVLQKCNIYNSNDLLQPHYIEMMSIFESLVLELIEVAFNSTEFRVHDQENLKYMKDWMYNQQIKV